jgi:hypothetical protein
MGLQCSNVRLPTITELFYLGRGCMGYYCLKENQPVHGETKILKAGNNSYPLLHELDVSGKHFILEDRTRVR